MDQMNRKENFFLQKHQKMSTHFAWLTTVLIAIVGLLISISVLNFFNDIIYDINFHNKQKDIKIASKIFDVIKDNFDKNNPSSIKKYITFPLEEGTIAYVNITDKNTNSEILNIKGKNKYIYNEKYQINSPEFIFDNYIVTIGFYDKGFQKDYIKDFINKISILTISCIFLGLLMAYFMFKIVNKPMEELIRATEDYKKGNFSSHIKQTHYQEINTLIDTYNSMGESLKELYTSLEMKVEKRTVELEKAYKELQQTQAMMVHSEKMKSLGELVAGITHEINNPVNFIYGNLIHLKNYSENMINFIETLLGMMDISDERIKNKIDELKNKYDFNFIHDDLPDLIKSCQDGAERTKAIIMNLKDFSRMGENATSSIDLAHEIDITLNILHNKIKNRIKIHKDYAPDMPKIDAFGGQLNQVFMNIFDNAAYAIKNEGNIKISMQHDEKYVTIKIEDDGCGMDKETAERLFDPFFTTKPVGQGTGLGMSITYKIVKNHNGEIYAESEKGKGTTFTIILPIVNKVIEKGV